MGSSASADVERVRLDKWLWAARFFKTRSQAGQAVTGGKVHVNGARAKAGHGLKVGDGLRITKAGQVFEIEVRALSGRRGSATQAQRLYAETEASRRRREREEARHRAARMQVPRPRGRPDRKARRQLRRFKQSGPEGD